MHIMGFPLQNILLFLCLLLIALVGLCILLWDDFV